MAAPIRYNLQIKMPTAGSAGLGLIETCGTNTDKLKRMSEDFKTGALCRFMGNADIESRRSIYHPATVEATNMVVVVRHPIKSFEAGAELDSLNFSAGGKNFKVAINGTKADAG